MSDGSEQLGQDEIENLLGQVGAGSPNDAGAPVGGGSAPAEEPGGSISQEEIEAMMSGGAPPSSAGTATAPSPSPMAAPAVSPGSAANDVELLLNRAEEAIASLDDPAGELPPGVQPFRLEAFGGTPANEDTATIELVRDVQLELKIELGRTRMPLEDVLRLRRDAVVTLDKLAGDPVDVYANGRLIARGEVLVLNDNFCVRVTELIVGDSAVA